MASVTEPTRRGDDEASEEDSARVSTRTLYIFVNYYFQLNGYVLLFIITNIKNTIIQIFRFVLHNYYTKETQQTNEEQNSENSEPHLQDNRRRRSLIQLRGKKLAD